MGRTTITLSEYTKNELFQLKREESETYDDVVRRLLREREEPSVADDEPVEGCRCVACRRLRGEDVPITREVGRD